MRIRKIDNNHAEIKMYGDIGGWFIDGFNFTSILDSLEEDGYKEATFRMHCYGGSVFEGDVIGGAFARSKMKINIIIDGLAASMGCMILPYVPHENVHIAANAFGMIHRPEGGGRGNASDLLRYAKLLLDIEGNFIKTLSDRTGKTPEEIKTYFDGSDHWLNADEMIQLKLAGKKIDSVASIKQLDKEVVEQMTPENAYGHYAAKLELEPNSKNQNNSKMKKELIDAFSLNGLSEDSSDTAVIAALQNKFKDTTDRLEALEKAAKDKVKADIKSRLDKAETDGNITAATRPTYEKIAENSGVEALDTVLDSVKPADAAATPDLIVNHIKGEKPGGSGSKKTWAWYQENDPNTLEEMPGKDPATFKALYKSEFGVEPALD